MTILSIVTACSTLTCVATLLRVPNKILVGATGLDGCREISNEDPRVSR
jgi:hypothetical protein